MRVQRSKDEGGVGLRMCTGAGSHCGVDERYTVVKGPSFTYVLRTSSNRYCEVRFSVLN